MRSRSRRRAHRRVGGACHLLVERQGLLQLMGHPLQAAGADQVLGPRVAGSGAGDSWVWGDRGGVRAGSRSPVGSEASARAGTTSSRTVNSRET